MKLRLLLALAIAFSLAGCGVKGDLEKPNGQPAPKTEKDNSRPPNPIGR
jgi:predicted small lipoprotein YifL